MNLVTYLNLRVYIKLVNGFYYTGKVTDADEESITLFDKFGKLVSLQKDSIFSIQEVE